MQQPNATARWIAIIVAVILGCGGIIFGLLQKSQATALEHSIELIKTNTNMIESNRVDIKLNTTQIVDLRMQTSVFNSKLQRIIEQLDRIEKNFNP